MTRYGCGRLVCGTVWLAAVAAAGCAGATKVEVTPTASLAFPIRPQPP